jgi:hypothetical protein
MNIPEGQVTATIYKVFLALLPVAPLQNSLLPTRRTKNAISHFALTSTQPTPLTVPTPACFAATGHFSAADQRIEAHRGDVDPARVLAVVPQRWFLHLNCPSQRRNSIVCLANRCHHTKTRTALHCCTTHHLAARRRHHFTRACNLTQACVGRALHCAVAEPSGAVAAGVLPVRAIGFCWGRREVSTRS